MFFFGDTRGGITIVFALILPVILGLCALVVDIANLRWNQSQLQLAADSGALAAAAKISNLNAARTAALTMTQLNAPQGSTNITNETDIEFGIFDVKTNLFSSSSAAPNAVRVTSSRDQAHNNTVETLFIRAFALTTATSLRAVSIAMAGTDACLYVLDPSASGAIQFIGGVSVAATCRLQINSTSNSAITTFGLFSVSTSATCVVGSYSSFLSLGTFTPKPLTGCGSRSDPLADIPEPVPISSCSNVNVTIPLGGTLNPGCYTGTTTFGGTIRLNPGTYQFKGAIVSVLGAGMLVGDEVTLYFDKASTFNMVALSALSLSAPKTGTYQGVVIFMSRASVNSSLNIIGGTFISINGTIYAPATNLTLTGVGSIATKYGYFIVNRLVATGLSAMKFNAFPSDPRRPIALDNKPNLVQ